MNTVAIDPDVKRRVSELAKKHHGICLKSILPPHERRVIYTTVQSGCLSNEEIANYLARKIKTHWIWFFSGRKKTGFARLFKTTKIHF